ncbi:hypothetical protein MYAM1_002379 [Malassezia yamatoensis]|uniref:Uncharacterized protein n=1 Tax=Malassezia yamatoensis TaxID=253288 RepID=A0AAJ5YSH7_9BASI|nr:hypothetical protein MYAM1_002379 [Malassezia yamatoensis]
MGTPSNFALMRRMVRQGVHWNPSGSTRNSARFANEKLSLRRKNGFSSVPRRYRLNRYFQITIEKLKPLWQGALGTFKASQSSGNLSRNQVPKGFSSAPFSSSTPNTALGRFASMRARLPSGPQFKPSIRHGAGLQSARSFSSGPQGARLFESVITNAPLALRAAGCELQNSPKSQNCMSQATAFAQTLVSHRYGVTCSFQSKDSTSKYSDLLFDEMDHVPASKQLPEESCSTMQCSQTLSEPYQEKTDLRSREIELRHYFRDPMERKLPRNWTATMYVPLEPDIPDRELWKYSANFDGGATCILDDAMREKLLHLQGVYQTHRVRLQALEHLLREIHVWPKHMSVAELCHTTESGHPMALQIDLADWRKEQVMHLLQDRFGSLDWLSISESCED